MLHQIGSVDQVPTYVERAKKGEFRLMGFGHRVYMNYDPRARVVREVAGDVFKVTGVNPVLEVAMELERIALSDDYFIEKKLYPNVDFYTGLIYEAIGFPVEMFPVLFAIGRMPGWLAQWEEGLLDEKQKIARPRQLYVGAGERAPTSAWTSGKRPSRTCFNRQRNRSSVTSSPTTSRHSRVEVTSIETYGSIGSADWRET
jgi:citrate synthase